MGKAKKVLVKITGCLALTVHLNDFRKRNLLPNFNGKWQGM